MFVRHILYQPYPLLATICEQGELSPRTVPLILLTSMLALSLRMSRHPFLQNEEKKARVLQLLADSTWDALCTAHATQDFDLTYFQALCFLAEADFSCKSTTPHR